MLQIKFNYCMVIQKCHPKPTAKPDMHSIKEIYKIGHGPSSSHTMGPRIAAELFLIDNPGSDSFRVVLYGSLAATGKGHFTDITLTEAFSPKPVQIEWKAEEYLPFHPNGMRFEALAGDGTVENSRTVYSTGGGELSEGQAECEKPCIYQVAKLTEVMDQCEKSGKAFWEYVEENEDVSLGEHISQVWKVMQEAIEKGLKTEGVLPGGLGLSRKAVTFYRKANLSGEHFRRGSILSAYALAVSEENASCGVVVTAPTCGSCGVLPSVLKYMQELIGCDDDSIIRALKTAGLIGNFIKHNASISGAEVGCQGEIGSACAMAAGAAAQLMGGTVHQVEYAAEMGLEHHLGLTCDPVEGLVQIPCIERNAFAAKRALDCADYSIFSGGVHRISFDEVVSVMKKTGHDIPPLYRETSSGGLAEVVRKREQQQ